MTELPRKVEKTVSEEPPSASKSTKKEFVDEKFKAIDIGNPVEFWTAWSNRRNLCLQHSDSKQASCTCFEGIGSVM